MVQMAHASSSTIPNLSFHIRHHSFLSLAGFRSFVSIASPSSLPFVVVVVSSAIDKIKFGVRLYGLSGVAPFATRKRRAQIALAADPASCWPAIILQRERNV
uniref:Uncharacterized protein n=1 Tax=Ditylum brightwellii TaxID=49249 RepID=A0A6V2MFJ6_9STRA